MAYDSFIVSDTWMCLERGEGEKEIVNHGRSRVKSFSQETAARGQQTPMIGENEPRLHTQSQVQNAQDSQTQLPIFFSFNDDYGAPEDIERAPSGVCSSDGSGTCIFSGTVVPFRFFFISIFVSSIAFAQVEMSGSDLPKNNMSQRVLSSEQVQERQKFKTFAPRFMGKRQQKPAEERLREVSDMYEKHFLRSMLKGMRSTVKEGGFININQAEKIFREQLDDHYVEKWGEKGGIGLSNMIYQQLIDKFGQQMGIRSGVTRPKGPLPLDAASGNRIMPFKHPGKKDAMSYRIDPVGFLGTQEVKVGSVRNVKVPWDGVLRGSRPLADSQTMLEIEHDNGLKSQMVFRGSLSKFSTGQKVQAGETVGFLSSEAKSLYWTVEPVQTSRSPTVSE